MSRSRFTEAVRVELLAAIRGGASLPDACSRVGISPHTVKSWLQRGRREEGTPHAAFAAAVDGAREASAVEPMDDDEFQAHLDRAVRAGSVQAMKLWGELRSRRGDQEERPVDALDELAGRRRRRAV